MSKLVEKGISEFIDELASDSPTPGGGSVAALSGALGCALSSMVCNLTIGKEKYKDVEKEMKEVVEKSERLRNELTDLIDRDTNAFNDVIKAFKMPKETEKQKKHRKKAIQEGYKKAASVPLETAEKCREILDVAKIVAEKGNPNSVTDASVCALMAKAGILSAVLNVQINLGSIKDEKFVEDISSEIEELKQEAYEKTSDIMDIVEGKM